MLDNLTVTGDHGILARHSQRDLPYSLTRLKADLGSSRGWTCC